MKRYTPVINKNTMSGDQRIDLVEDPDGELVKVSDIRAPSYARPAGDDTWTNAHPVTFMSGTFEAAEIALCIRMRVEELAKPANHAYLETDSMKRNKGALIDWLRKVANDLEKDQVA
jgi:hypothetical protein